MSEQIPHRHFRHFSELPASMRTLFTGALLAVGLGYLFALLYVFAAHAGADGNSGFSVDDIKITYGGNRESSQLESALRGPMSGMLPKKDMDTLLDWMSEGGGRRGYDARIEGIFATSCLDCHDGSNPHLSNLDSYENVQAVLAQDSGADLYTLVRVSHIHLFGLTFIFFIIGFIFSHAYLRPIWLKCLIVVAPFVGVIADVLGWYVTKVYAPFAWVVLIAGAVNGMAFAVMWLVSMYQMWIYKPPPHITSRDL